MSIRLKKMQWFDRESYSLTRIAGVQFNCWSVLLSEPDGEWKASHSFGRRYATREEAKAACEQHALERIREAVEVVDDHIPDAKKMIDENHSGDATEKVEVVGETFQVTAPVLYERLNELVTDLNNLISDSAGIYGLPLNGDLAPWDELTEGGRFEEWLISLRRAEQALQAYESTHSQEIPDGWQPLPKPPKEGKQ